MNINESASINMSEIRELFNNFLIDNEGREFNTTTGNSKGEKIKYTINDKILSNGWMSVKYDKLKRHDQKSGKDIYFNTSGSRFEDFVGVYIKKRGNCNPTKDFRQPGGNSFSSCHHAYAIIDAFFKYW